jgi:hypothetical protein
VKVVKIFLDDNYTISISNVYRWVVTCERACSPCVLSSIARGSKFLRHSLRQRSTCGDFVNFEDVSVHVSKMLLEVVFAHIVYRGECACIVSVFAVLCKSKKIQVVDRKIFINSYLLVLALNDMW